jgi:hypothetical protein
LIKYQVFNNMGKGKEGKGKEKESGGKQKWVAKKPDAVVADEPPAATPEPEAAAPAAAKKKPAKKAAAKKAAAEKKASDKAAANEPEEAITSPILLALPSTGPTYSKLNMLQYYQQTSAAKAAPSQDKLEAARARRDAAEKVASASWFGASAAQKKELEDAKAALAELEAAACTAPVLSERPPEAPDETLAAKRMAVIEQRRDSRKMSKTKSTGAAEQDGDQTPASYTAASPYAQWYNTMIAMEYAASTAAYTTVMFRNFPYNYTRDTLVQRLDESYKACYDFLYMPIDSNTKGNYGYAFINFKSPLHAQRFIQEFHQKKAKVVIPGCNSIKTCEVSFARVQGRDANLENLREQKFLVKLSGNSEAQPLFYDDQGAQIPFSKLAKVKPDATPTGAVAAASTAVDAFMMPQVGHSPELIHYPGAVVVPPTKEEMSVTELLPDATDKTMVMMKHIPKSMTRGELVERVNSSFKGECNFVYLIETDSGEGNRGIAFVNLKTPEKTQKFIDAFNTKVLGEEGSETPPCDVGPVKITQVDKNIQRLRQNLAKSKDGKDRSSSYPTFLNASGEVEEYPMPSPGSLSKAMAAKSKAKAKAKAAKPEKNQKMKISTAPGGPLMPGQIYPAYPYGSFEQYMQAAAAAQAQANIHQMMNSRVQSGLLDPLAAAVRGGQGKQLGEEDKKNLRSQLEYYFSVGNLCKDLFLRSHMDQDGWAPVELIGDFPRVRKYKASVKGIIEALKDSEVLEVDAAKKQVRLKDETLRSKWTKLPDEYRQIYTPKSGTQISLAASTDKA